MLVSIADQFALNKSIPSGRAAFYAYQQSITKEPIMSTPHPFPPQLPLYRPVAVRWADRWREALSVPVAAWRRWMEHRQREHRYDAVLELSPFTLKDIGAPDWVVSHAQSRREVEAHRVDDFRLGVRELPSRW
jgi:hypothetical protein